MHPPDRPAYGLFQTAPPYLRAALADTFRRYGTHPQVPPGAWPGMPSGGRPHEEPPPPVRLAGPEERELLRRLSVGLDVPLHLLDPEAPVPPRPQLSRRERAARHVGQAGWRVGYTVAQAGRVLERTGDRLIDAGDWLAARVAGRR